MTMYIDDIFRNMQHAMKALDPSVTRQPIEVSPRAAATARKPQVQTLGNEGSSPRADLGTAEVSVSQYRARIYEFERLIDRLYDLARADRFDELHDELRAEYRAIHGPSI